MDIVNESVKYAIILGKQNIINTLESVRLLIIIY